jgi:DNA polymerase (family 10)
MPVANADIAAAFEQIADLLELRNANPFRVRAYRNAARVIGELSNRLGRQAI